MSLLKSLNSKNRKFRLLPKTTIIRMASNGYHISPRISPGKFNDTKSMMGMGDKWKREFIEQIKKTKIDISRSIDLAKLNTYFSINKSTERPIVLTQENQNTENEYEKKTKNCNNERGNEKEMDVDKHPFRFSSNSRRLQNKNNHNLRYQHINTSQSEIEIENENEFNPQEMYKKNQLDDINADIVFLLNVIVKDKECIENVKKQLIPILANNENQEKFMEILFNKALNEPLFLNAYAKLLREIEKATTSKKEKTKSPLRVKLIEKCKKYFRASPIEDRFKYMNNIHFISSLIEQQMISKKVGIQCINNLYDKVQKSESKGERDLFLESSIDLANRFGEVVIYKQRSRIRGVDLQFFEKEIEKCIEKLSNYISHPQILSFISSKTYYKALNLIDKASNKFAPKNFLIIINDSSESETISEISDPPIEVRSLSQNILNDLLCFKRHIDYNGANSAYSYSWTYIDRVIMKDKIPMTEVISSFIDAANQFMSNQREMKIAYNYIHIILEYYNHYLSQSECDAIVDETLSNIKELAMNRDDRVKEVWIRVISALCSSNIFLMKNFNYFLKENVETIAYILRLMNDIAKFAPENRSYLLKEMRNTKIYKDNKDTAMSIMENK